MTPLRTISPTVARRLAIARQRLAGPRPAGAAGGPDAMLDLIRDLGCLQLDPTNAVARSHLLALWSRLGAYKREDLETLLWDERRLFEYWAHAASIVLTEDYPIHQGMMRAYGTGEATWDRLVRAWMDGNDSLRRHILDRLSEAGPLPARAFEDRATTPWRSGGWTAGRNVDRMLAFLWGQDVVTVAGRVGGQRLWDLTARRLPAWTSSAREAPLTEREIVYRAAQRSLRALGVARPAHIAEHFIRGRYPDLTGVLEALTAEGRIVPVAIGDEERTWSGPWYVHADDLPLLDRLETGEAWRPRTTLLSPFDNLICDRGRTEELFGFRFRLEIYLPRERRQYGYYVLPILHGDRLIGRIDPTMDRKRKRLTVNAVHVEPGVPAAGDTVSAVTEAIEELAAFLGARDIAYGERAPRGIANPRSMDRP